MDKSAVDRQIKQMVEFIKQEANEKSQEILTKAEEEFNMEKLRLVEQEKVKVKTEFDRKNKQVEIKKRIDFSNEVNASRLKVLQEREQVVQKVKDAVMQQLIASGEPSQPAYKEMLTKLILQALFQLKEDKVVVQARKSDSSVATTAAKDAAAQYKKATGKDCKVDVDPQNFLPDKNDPVNPCAGGCKMMTPDGRISVDNTLNARLNVVLAQKMPDVKIMLFGRSATRTHIDSGEF
mmetsp:Transcript_43711/g.102828  ORF Transcript_43711/g.102828 Transcript_43711/m.102828 type:complete len:236 (+) Transcript_43711:157-864(+)